MDRQYTESDPMMDMQNTNPYPNLSPNEYHIRVSDSLRKLKNYWPQAHNNNLIKFY